MIIGATSAERFNNESRPLFLFIFLMNDIFGGPPKEEDDAHLVLSSLLVHCVHILSFFGAYKKNDALQDSYLDALAELRAD